MQLDINFANLVAFTGAPHRAPSNQRWRDRRTSFVGNDDLFNPRDYEVSACDGKGSDKLVKAFIEQHHYSGSYPAARERILLHHCRTGELVGAAVFSHPASEAVLEPLPCERLEGVELGRFVLLDNVDGKGVGRNGETWFFARGREILRERGYKALLSYSDPMPRRALDGSLVLPGHIGAIYQASNAVYAGRSGKEKHVLKPDGRIFSPRSMSKIRKWERGAQKCVDELVEIGATPPTKRDLSTRDSRRAWMWREIFATCRRLRHNGNHSYLWALDKKLSREVEALAAVDADGNRIKYPKAVDAEATPEDN